MKSVDSWLGRWTYLTFYSFTSQLNKFVTNLNVSQRLRAKEHQCFNKNTVFIKYLIFGTPANTQEFENIKIEIYSVVRVTYITSN